MFYIVTGEPFKQSAELTGEPIKMKGYIEHWGGLGYCERSQGLEAYKALRLGASALKPEGIGPRRSLTCARRAACGTVCASSSIRLLRLPKALGLKP